MEPKTLNASEIQKLKQLIEKIDSALNDVAPLINKNRHQILRAKLS